jgi:hypothetical protein
MVRSRTKRWAAALGAITIVAVGHPRLLTAAAPAAKANASVTMNGCLREDGGKFVLTGLKGDQAPKGRSWKTGYIVKAKKDVVVTPASGGVKLKDHVGRQVTIAGVTNGGTKVTARSIRRVAASCSS